MLFAHPGTFWGSLSKVFLECLVFAPTRKRYLPALISTSFYWSLVWLCLRPWRACSERDSRQSIHIPSPYHAGFYTLPQQLPQVSTTKGLSLLGDSSRDATARLFWVPCTQFWSNFSLWRWGDRRRVHIEFKMWTQLCLNGLFSLVFVPYLIKCKVCFIYWLLENTQLQFFKGFSVATLRCRYWPVQVKSDCSTLYLNLDLTHRYCFIFIYIENCLPLFRLLQSFSTIFHGLPLSLLPWKTSSALSFSRPFQLVLDPANTVKSP